MFFSELDCLQGLVITDIFLSALDAFFSGEPGKVIARKLISKAEQMTNEFDDARGVLVSGQTVPEL